MDRTDSSSVRSVLLGGLAFGLAMGFLFGLVTGSVAQGIRTGLLCGVGFGLAMRWFLNQAMSTNRFELGGQAAGFAEGETIVHSGPANHFKGAEAVGGKLFLTPTRLRFRSHSMNVQTHDESYPLGDIIAVDPVRTLGLVPNGLRVQLRDGRSERFVVGGRAQWVARLREVTGAQR